MSFLPQSARSLTLVAALLVAASSHAQNKAPDKAPDKAPAAKPAPDVIVFTNGDQLTGALERGVGNSVVFKPSELTPATGHWLVNAFNGEWLKTEHPRPIAEAGPKRKT